MRARITGNNAINTVHGIVLSYSSSNIISTNNVEDTLYSILLVSFSNYNIISGNNVTENGQGVFLISSSSNSISANNIAVNNGPGVEVDYSSNNTICGDNLTNNYGGVCFIFSSDNAFWHNDLINNTRQAIVSTTVNSWDSGYPSGGNYWGDYNGTDLYTGLYQNQTGNDGIGDTPYIIDANNTDNYPLMNPYSTNSLSVTISPASSTLDVGQSQTFNSTVSGGTLQYTYQWFLNGTAVPDANSSSWTFTPTSAGTYTIYANVTDSMGVQSTSDTTTLVVYATLSGGGGCARTLFN